jgi:hypothetical protein
MSAFMADSGCGSGTCDYCRGGAEGESVVGETSCHAQPFSSRDILTVSVGFVFWPFDGYALLWAGAGELRVL